MEKVPPPYYCTSAGHHVLSKKCVFIAGSFLKKSVFNPFIAAESLSVLNSSNFVPKNGFPVVKGLKRERLYTLEVDI